MATTNISTEIVSITGVSAHAASDEFIVSAQKFIASSVPKELLWFAAAQSSAIQNSSGFDVYSSDSVLAVEREGYPATEVPFSMSKWIDDSASLYKATNLYPKWYHAQGKVFIKPDPSSGGSNDGYVYYVEHTQLDDDCDLRNAVVFHASAQEFAKLASGLSVSAVPPDVPSLSTVTFTSLDSDLDASAPTFTTATVSAGGVFGANSAPAYTKPGHPAQVSFEDFFNGSEDLNPFGDSDPGALSLSSTAPVIPSLTSVTFTSVDSSLDVVKPSISTATLSASSVYTGSAPSYTKPVSALGSAPTISDLSISSVAPVPPISPSFSTPTIGAITVASTTLSNLGVAPIYTSPTTTISGVTWATEYPHAEVDLNTALAAIVTNVDLANGIFDDPPVSPISPTAPDFSTPSIATTTVSSTTVSNLGTPPTYTAPVVGGDASELSSLDDLDADNTIDTHADQPEWDQWFATAAHLIEGEEDVELAAAQIQKINSYIQAYSGAMQNQLNIFNDANAEYQAKLQEGIQQAQINAQKAQTDAQLAATDVQQTASLLLQKEQQEYASKLQKYGTEVQEYQAKVGAMSSQAEGYLKTAEGYANEIQARLSATQTKIAEYQIRVQDALNTFNDANAEYQGKLQESIQQAQINAQKAQQQAQLDATDAQQEASLKLQKENQEYEASLRKYSAEVQEYQANVAKEVQQYQQNLEGDLRVWEAERQTDLQKYASDIQNELNEFNKENIAYQSAIQESMQEIQVANQVNLAQAQSDLQAATSDEDRDLQRQLQNGVNDMQAIVNDNQRKIALYQAETSTYQADVDKEIKEYTQKLSRYQMEMNTAFQAWQKTESDNIAVFQADIQNELNEFNKENVSFQANIQEAMQEIQVANQVNVAQGQASLQVAIDNENRSQQRQLQNGINDMQAIVQNNESLIAKYSAELQQYQAEVSMEIQENQQNITHYEKQADRYYMWAQEEINKYIQHNSKIINTQLAAQGQSKDQQQYRR